MKSSIDSFSISIQELQTKINTQLQKISIDQPSLQKSIQVQIQQAIANQSKPIESSIAMLITEKLDTQKRHTCWVGDLDWTAESFNRFIYGLSNRYKRQYHQSTTTGDSTEFRINHRPNRVFEEITKVSHADRNRSIFDRTNKLIATTKQLVSRTKRSLEQTGQFIKSILISYNEVEQRLVKKIETLNIEKEAQTALISAMKAELSNLEQGEFSEQLQREFQENLNIQLHRQLTIVLSQLNLKDTVRNLVQSELSPFQQVISKQQIDLEKALSEILQFQPPNDFYEDLEMQSKQINMLGETVERLMTLIKNLSN